MFQPRITYDGVPFIIAGERVYDYHQGNNGMQLISNEEKMLR